MSRKGSQAVGSSFRFSVSGGRNGGQTEGKEIVELKKGEAVGR